MNLKDFIDIKYINILDVLNPDSKKYMMDDKFI